MSIYLADHGANANDVFDNTAAFNSAIAAMKAAKDSRLVLTNGGILRVKGNVFFDWDLHRNGIEILGNGAAIRMIREGIAKPHFRIASAYSNVAIRNVRFLGYKEVAAQVDVDGYIMRIDNARSVTFDNCQIYGLRGANLDPSGDPFAGLIAVYTAMNFNWLNCDIEGSISMHGGAAVSLYNVSKALFRGSHFVDYTNATVDANYSKASGFTGQPAWIRHKNVAPVSADGNRTSLVVDSCFTDERCPFAIDTDNVHDVEIRSHFANSHDVATGAVLNVNNAYNVRVRGGHCWKFAQDNTPFARISNTGKTEIDSVTITRQAGPLSTALVLADGFSRPNVIIKNAPLLLRAS